MNDLKDINEVNNCSSKIEFSSEKRIMKAERCTREDIINFIKQLTENELERFNLCLGKQNILETAAKSFLVIKVIDQEIPKVIFGIFLYHIEGSSPITQIKLPFSISEFDFFGKFSKLKWFFIRSLNKNRKVEVFEINLDYYFCNRNRLKYLLIENSLKHENQEFGFLEDIEYMEPFNKEISLISKQNIIPPLIIRPAREEDHDDLIEICNKQSKLQSEDHGNFFIAEMIAYQHHDKLCLVAENEENKVIGMMLISSKIDLLVLHQHFELTPYGMFCKDDFSESVNAFIEQENRMKIFEKEIESFQQEEKHKVLRQMSSYQQNIRLIQKFAIEKLLNNLEEFEDYQNVKEKKEKLSNIILKKLIDKYFKHFEFSQPDSFFEKVNDHEVSHFIISPTDFLLEILYDFNLPKKYLKGEGHWKPWTEKEIQRLIEEQRNKGILNKRRPKNQKKNKDKNKNEISLPEGFDIEPFLVSLKHFLKSDIEIRNEIALLFLNNESNLIELYSEKNGEIDYNKKIEFSEIIELIERKNGVISSNIKKLVLPTLVLFGSLDYESKIVCIADKKPFNIIINKQKKQNKNSSLSNQGSFAPFFQLNEKKLTYIKLNDLMDSINQILQEDSFFNERENIIENQMIFIEKKKENGMEEIKHEFSKLNYKYFDVIKNNGIAKSIQEIPSHLMNAACISIFFISDNYAKRATDFIPYVFNHIPDKEYLILTQSRMSSETFLISNFQKVKQKRESNFNHSLFFYHKSNLFSHLLNVKPIYEDEFLYIQKKLFPKYHSEEDLQKKYHDKIRDIKYSKKNMKEIFKIKKKSIVYDNKFVKEEPDVKKAPKTKKKKRNFAKKFEKLLESKNTKQKFNLKEKKEILSEKIEDEKMIEKDEVFYFKLVFESEELKIKNDLGIANVSSISNILQIMQNFDLSPLSFSSTYSKPDFIEIKNIQVNLLFNSFSLFFMREILRLTNKKVILLSPENIENCTQVFPHFCSIPKLYESKFLKSKQTSNFINDYEVLCQTLSKELTENLQCNMNFNLNDILKNRMNFKYEKKNEISKNNSSKLGVDLFSLSNKKSRVNLKILIIGNSSTSIGIINRLLNLSNIRFENIILLSTEFITDTDFFKLREEEKNIQENFIERLYLEHNITLIRGEMTVLDRKTKTILAKSFDKKTFTIAYDKLIITTGLTDKTKQTFSENGIFNNIFNLDLEKDISSQQNTNSQSSLQMGNSDKNPNNSDNLSKNDSLGFQKNIRERSIESSSVVQGSHEEQNYKENFAEINKNFIVSISSIKNDILKTKFQKNISNKEELFECLKKEKNWTGKLLHHKIPQNVTLYGESADIFSTLDCLISDFKIDVSKICIVIPSSNSPLYSNKLLKTEYSNLNESGLETNEKILEIFDKKIENPILFDNQEIKEFYFSILDYFGIHVLKGYDIFGLCTQPNSFILKREYQEPGNNTERKDMSYLSDASIIDEQNKISKKFIEYSKLLKNFKFGINVRKLPKELLKIFVDYKEEKIFDYRDLDILRMVETNSIDEHILNKSSKKLNLLKYSEQKYGLYKNINEEGDTLLKNTILLTGNKVDVGSQIFTAVQENGLVFNGRLIVINNFRTIDRHIFACGKISEFSQRYKNETLGKSLRMDKFDGFEVGENFADQFITKLMGKTYNQDEIQKSKQQCLKLDKFMNSYEKNQILNPSILKELNSNFNLSKNSFSLSKSNIKSGYNFNDSKLETKRKEQEKKIPSLNQPITKKIKLFPGYYFLSIKKPYQGKVDFSQKRTFESTNTLHRDILTLMNTSSDVLIYNLSKKDKNIFSAENIKINPPKIYHYNSNQDKISSSLYKIKKNIFSESENQDLEKILQNGSSKELEKILVEKKNSYGHYLLFEFDQNDLISKIEYFGKNEPILEAFNNIFGLHKTFFNKMFERKNVGLIEDFVEFIEQEWAKILSDPFFPKIKYFLNEIFEEILAQNEINHQEVLAEVLENLMNESNQQNETSSDFIYESLMNRLPSKVSVEIKKKIKEYICQFINHFKI